VSETTGLDLAELGRLLERVAPHKSVPEVMGSLTALASAPASPHPSEWLLTLTDDARFDDEDDARRFLMHVLEAYRQIDMHLQVGEEVGPDATDPKAVAQWCHGYFQTARRDPTWSAEPDAMRRMMPMALLAGELDRVGEASTQSDAIRNKWTGALGNLAASLYEHWSEARAAHKPQPPAADSDDEPDDTAPFRRSEPKIGRNAPCHCGSGKKFKHCHGAN
jgi:yecA family protein